MKLLYSPTSSREEAKSIAACLLEEKLVACVNILPGITSYFWWEGKVQSSKEVILLAKTTNVLANAASERITELHSYACPCVLTLPIENSNPDFAQWVDEQVGQK